MASNQFDRLIDENIRAIRNHRQNSGGNFAMEQSRRNTKRTRENKMINREHRKQISERNRPSVQRYYDQGRMQGVASGRKDPRRAMLEISPTPETLAAVRPETFGAAPGAAGGGGATGGGRTGIPGMDYGDAFKAAGSHLEALSDPAAQAELPAEDAAGNPLTPEQARAYVARQRLQSQARMAGEILPQQNRVATMPEAYQNRMADEARNREHFDNNLIESLVDAEGNPVDASRAGEEGVYRKFTHQGRGSDPGRDMQPEQRSVTAVGFGDDRQAVQRAQPASRVETAISRVFGRKPEGGGREDSDGRQRNAGISDDLRRRAALPKQQGAGEKPSKSRASRPDSGNNTQKKKQPAVRDNQKPSREKAARPEQAGAARGKSVPRPRQSVMGEKGEGFAPLEIRESDNETVRSMKERMNRVLTRERDPEKVRQAVSDFFKWWDRTSSRNMP